jgi:hypothetical protein
MKPISPGLALVFVGLAALSLGSVDQPIPAPPPIADGLSEVRSDPPEAADWGWAREVSLARASEACKAVRLREWTRVTCEVSSDMGASLVAGPREGVRFAHEPFGSKISIVFPVRRGDRRVLEMMKGVSSPFVFSAYSFEPDVAFVVSESWLSEEDAPIIVVD